MKSIFAPVITSLIICSTVNNVFANSNTLTLYNSTTDATRTTLSIEDCNPIKMTVPAKITGDTAESSNISKYFNSTGSTQCSVFLTGYDATSKFPYLKTKKVNLGTIAFQVNGPVGINMNISSIKKDLKPLTAQDGLVYLDINEQLKPLTGNFNSSASKPYTVGFKDNTSPY